MTNKTRLQPTVAFEDVEVGTILPPLVKKPSAVQLFCFSAVTWDTHRTHFDEPYSKNVDKLPGILTHGHLQGSFLGNLMTSWAGPRARLLRLAYQNRGMSVAGDTLNCGGKVTAKKIEGTKGLVTCQVWIENQKGEITTSGEAVVQLPYTPIQDN